MYAKEDILSQQGEVLVEKDMLLEKKATDENGQLTFDSDLYHGKYYVKEEVRKPGYRHVQVVPKAEPAFIGDNLQPFRRNDARCNPRNERTYCRILYGIVPAHH